MSTRLARKRRRQLKRTQKEKRFELPTKPLEMEVMRAHRKKYGGKRPIPAVRPKSKAAVNTAMIAAAIASLVNPYSYSRRPKL